MDRELIKAFEQMRPTTKEERQGVDNYIDSISQKVLTIPIPENATNGDVIEAVFHGNQEMNCGSNGEYIYIWSNDGKCQMTIHVDWWNASYKAESDEYL